MEVVTVGPDWPAIAAGITTGVVGLAGIGGTLWQGKRSREAQTADLKASLDATADNLKVGINAENERARLAEKRRIYARCTTALLRVQKAGAAMESAASHEGGEDADL